MGEGVRAPGSARGGGDGGSAVPSPRVVVVGNLTLDDVVLWTGATRMGAVGGNSVYAALGARLWEPLVGLVTRRGEDFPAQHLARLRGLGIDVSGVTDIPGPTVRNWVIYEEDGRRTWVYRTPAGRSREVAPAPADLPAPWLADPNPPVVHVAAMPLEAAERIVDRVRREAPAARLTLDTHEDWGRDRAERVFALAARVHAFLPSREELAELTGIPDPVRALGRLAGLPTPVLVVKAGPEGSLVWDRASGQRRRVGPSPGPVLDVTGAGDGFCGGFAAGLAGGLPAVEAARRGAVSAAFAIADFSSLHLAEVGPREAADRLASAPPPVEPMADPPDQPPTAVPRGDRRAIEVMRREIDTIPEVIADHLAGLAGPIDELAGDLAPAVRRLVLTGCGDSMFAAQASALSFVRHAGIEAEAVHAMELARYRVRYLAEGSVVVCISYSGEVGRTIEAAAQAAAFGHRVVALTGRRDGRLAATAGATILLDVPTLGFSPGTSTYVAMLAALARLATGLGAARGRDVGEAGRALDGMPERAAATLAATMEPARQASARLAGAPWIPYLGAGPNEASARFGAAKLFEGPQMLGTSTNLEEWAHEEYFLTRPGQPVVVVAPTGAASDRAGEILDEMAFVGAEPFVVSDGAPSPPATHLPVAGPVPEELSPILAALPLSLVGFFLSEATGRRSYNFPTAQAEREHYETIHRDTRGTPA